MTKKITNAGQNKKVLKQCYPKLEAEIAKFKKAVEKLQSDLDTLQKGENGVAYWSGELAYNWIKTALAHCDHDKVLLDHLDNCLDEVERNIKGAAYL